MTSDRRIRIRDALERRILVLAPFGRDAALIESMLAEPMRVSALGGVTPCRALEQLVNEAEHGAGVLVVAEEALADHDESLARLIGSQPPWSDLPVLLLTRAGANSDTVAFALRALGNVTLLERPVRVSALRSSVSTALRARQRQYQIRAYLDERDRADRTKDEFLATLAHELRNPLAPIRNSIELLRLTRTDARTAEVLETMERQIVHVTRLVDDLMDVSRVTRGKIELQKHPVALSQVLQSAIEISRPLIEAAGHRFSVALPSPSLVVDADPVRLAQVFSNLLNNAVKYTDAGGRIDVSTRVRGGRAIVEFTDSGIGIAPEVLPRVFDMFYQADVHGARALTGLGIGLTLSRSVLDMHDGTITAASRGAGRGSTFTVSLPILRDTPAAAPHADAIAALPTTPRVLVVDDNRDAADSLARLLQQLGAEVRVAHDGAEAIDAFDDFRPAATFLDIGMPGMDGYEVASRIRAQHNGDAVLVALTGWGQEQDRRRTQAAGFRHHMVKPATVQHLREVLASIG